MVVFLFLITGTNFFWMPQWDKTTYPNSKPLSSLSESRVEGPPQEVSTWGHSKAAWHAFDFLVYQNELPSWEKHQAWREASLVSLSSFCVILFVWVPDLVWEGGLWRLTTLQGKKWDVALLTWSPWSGFVSHSSSLCMPWFWFWFYCLHPLYSLCSVLIWAVECTLYGW